MQNNSDIDLSTTLFGREQSMPFGLGPTGLGGIYARPGEGPAARALPVCLSSLGVPHIEFERFP